jgi:anaerobic selenocysteine-containing dehydrogenase
LGLGGQIFAPNEILAEAQGGGSKIKTCLAQCPYCGVGCGSVIKYEADSGRILGCVPDKQHPTNKGVQCIKGLNADEPVYIDRLTKVLVRKDMSDPMTGHVSKTKGSFDPDDFYEVTYEEAEHIVAEKLGQIYKKDGGNSIGLYGSGQLTVEAQWIENKFMKGVLGSNSIEANARMCMTSAVTAYFATLGSDTPPLCYDDIELSDMITFWGHNPRGAHTIVFWRAADHKAKKGIPTVISDPRRTGSVQALESINPENSHHIQTINGDISVLNALAHCILTEHEDIVEYDFLKKNTVNWEEYIKMCREEYSPEQVTELTGVEPQLIRDIADDWANATRKGKRRGKGGVISFWGIGYNQHIHGQHNVISVINLHALTGNLGRPGAGPFSMTGQPNAMGERLMGGLTGRLPFNQGIKGSKGLNLKGIETISKAWNC